MHGRVRLAPIGGREIVTRVAAMTPHEVRLATQSRSARLHSLRYHARLRLQKAPEWLELRDLICGHS